MAAKWEGAIFAEMGLCNVTYRENVIQ